MCGRRLAFPHHPPFGKGPWLGSFHEAKVGRRGVTIVILLVLVVVLWIAVLAPSAWRHRSERRGVGSIDHFHHQLELLEHAGPKLMAPAYRLHTAFPGGGSAETSGAPAEDLSRPKLVLLRPTDDEDSADIDGDDGCHYERIGVLGSPEPPECATETRAELAAYQRQQARQRCTMLLRGATATVVLTALIGAFPGLHLAWVVTGISGVSALGLLGLIGYAREVEAQRRSHRAATMLGQQWSESDFDLAPSAATAGYPGAWDQYDEYDVPQQAAAR
jgi:hypothetical protein